MKETEGKGRESLCEFFHFIGGRCCDNCGRSAKEHKGYHVLKRGAAPVGNDDPWENLTWDEWDVRVAEEKRAREAREKLAKLPDNAVIAFVEGLS